MSLIVHPWIINGITNKTVMGKGEGQREERWTIVARRNAIEQKPHWEDLITIFVDNLPESTSADQLRGAFTIMGGL